MQLLRNFLRYAQPLLLASQGLATRHCCTADISTVLPCHALFATAYHHSGCDASRQRCHSEKPHCVQTTQAANTLTQDNKHSRAASLTQARTHACVLAHQLQDSQADIKELMAEVVGWQKLASEAAAQLQHRDAQVLTTGSLCKTQSAFGPSDSFFLL